MGHMPGLGTIVNMAAIVLGGILGRLCGKLLSKKNQEAIMGTCGVMTFFLGVGGAMAQMLKVDSGILSTQGSMMMIFSLLIGTVVGELLDIEGKLVSFGEWLRNRTGNANNSGFVTAFVTASLTVCIGAMAIIGSIEDGIYGNHTILFTKAILDFIIVFAMAAALGSGAIFSAIPVGILQGTVTILASIAAPLMTDAAMANLSYVGNILIACVGVNLLFPNKISVANMLPSLIVAIVWAFLPF